MSRWEVRTRGGSIEVEGANWLLAVGVALPALGLEAHVLSRLVCDVRPDGVVRIVDPVSRTPLLVRRIEEAARQDGAHAVVPVAVVAAGGPADPIDDLDDAAVAERADVDDVDLSDAPPPPALELPLPAAPTYNPELDEAPEHPTAADTIDPAALDAPEPGHLAPPPPVVPEAGRYSPDVPDTPPADFTDVHLQTLDDLDPLLGDLEPAGPEDPPEDLAEQLFMEGMDVADARSIEEAADKTLSIIQKFVPAESSSVLFASINDTTLRFIAVHGPTADQVRSLRVPLGHGLAGFCFDTGASLIIRNAGADPRHFSGVDEETGYRTDDLLTVPLRDSVGRIHGCIQLLNAPSGFATWHLEATSTLGSTLADFILSQSA